jgi:hypothetical protein
VRGDDDPRRRRRLRELSFDDSRERQVAERAVPVPALEPGLGADPSRLGARIEVGQRRQPVDTRDPVARPAAALGVLEMVREKARIRLGEPELPELLERIQAETSGSGFTIPTPASRFVAEIASASERIACETSASGSTSTIGSPSSA